MARKKDILKKMSVNDKNTIAAWYDLCNAEFVPYTPAHARDKAFNECLVFVREKDNGEAYDVYVFQGNQMITRGSVGWWGDYRWADKVPKKDYINHCNCYKLVAGKPTKKVRYERNHQFDRDLVEARRRHPWGCDKSGYNNYNRNRYDRIILERRNKAVLKERDKILAKAVSMVHTLSAELPAAFLEGYKAFNDRIILLDDIRDAYDDAIDRKDSEWADYGARYLKRLQKLFKDAEAL